MSEELIREVYREARAETSGKAAQLSAVVFREDRWMLLLRDGDDAEVAIQVDAAAAVDRAHVKQQIVEQMRLLF